MGLLSYLTGRDIDAKAISGTPQVLEAIRSRQFSQYISLGSSPNARRDNRINSVYVATQNASYGWIYRCQPSARRVIDYLAGNVAQLGVKLYERVDDDDRRQVGDHPAAQALRRPNPFTPGKSFIKGLVKDFLIYDNAYAVKIRSPNIPLTLVRVSPASVGILGQSHFQPDGYRIGRADGSWFDIEPTDIIHWRGENPEDPRRGESKLETLREELSLDAANRQAGAELAISGLALPGWITRAADAPEWSSEARQRFEEDWANRAKAGKRRTPVLEDGMEFHSGGVSPEDAELLGSRRFAQEYVASLYGMKNVPPDTADERKHFWMDVVPDYTGQLADFLTLQILQQEYGLTNYYFEFNLDEKLMGDDRLMALTSAAGAPILLRDEARSRLNLPALPDDIGQEPITPMNVTVGGKPSPQAMPPQNPNGPPQDGSFRSGEANEPNEAGSRALEPAQKKLLHPRRVAKNRRRDESAQEFTTAIGGFLSHMERSLKSKGMDTKAVEDERWGDRLAKALFGVALKEVGREGEITAARIASSFDVGRAENYVATVSDSKAREIVSAVRGELQKEGADPSEVFKFGRDVAAVNAGMTLATGFSRFATVEAGNQSPNEHTKTWVVTSANSDHPEMDGESVPLGESFSNGTDGPPADHPGCQCLLDIDVSGKSLEPVQAPQPQMPAMHITVNLPENMVNVAPSPAPNVTIEPGVTNVTTPDVTVGDTHLTIEKGAMSAPNVTVEPAQTTFEEGAFSVDVKSAEAAPNITVTNEQPKTSKRIVRDENGLIKEIVEANRKQVIKRDPETKRIQSIEEE